MHLAKRYPLILCGGPEGKDPRMTMGKGWGNKRCTPEQIDNRKAGVNVGLVLGPKSGVIDIECDTPKAEDDFQKLFDGCDIPETPSYRSTRGRHRLYKWDERLDAIGKIKVMYDDLEVRLGAGGKQAQSVIPPSTGRTWEVSLDDMDPAPLPEPVIERLLALKHKPKATTDKHKATMDTATGGRPGDDFNQRGEWDDILLPAGWTNLGTDSDGKTLWKRPGKVDDGPSATTGFCTEGGKDRLYVFSTNAAPFESEKAYNKFAAYTLLNHGGNFALASEDLAKQGYGESSGGGKGKDKGPTVADMLVAIGMEDELFHDPNDTAYATANVNAVFQTWPVESTGYRRSLIHRFRLRHNKTPNAQAIKEARDAISAAASIDGSELKVYTRVASLGDVIYVDLCNDKWQAVEVTKDGWRVIDKPPVKFRRPRGMLGLPEPVNGGSIDELRKFVNVVDDDWPLTIAVLVGTFNPAGKFAVTILHSEQGSAKTTTAEVIRKLVDPNTVLTRSAPDSLRDCAISGNNNWLIAYDNLSSLPGWLSDACCRISGGAGFGTRALWENDEEWIVQFERPILITGIENVAIRGDITDRAILIELPKISDVKRLTSEEFWDDFEACHPRIFGALLNLVSGAIREKPNVRLPGKPRMADFAVWNTASEKAGGWGVPEGSFMTAYMGNRQAAIEQVLDAPVPNAIRQVMATQKKWEGTASNLQEMLQRDCADIIEKAKKDWPSNARALSAKLTRFKPQLRSVGIDIDNDRSSNRRVIVINNLAL